MNKALLIFTIATLAPSLEGQVPVPPPATAATRPPTIQIDRVAAIVGDQPVLWSDVLAFINQQRAAGVQIPADSAGQEAFAKDALNQLIDEESLVQKAHEMIGRRSAQAHTRPVQDRGRIPR